MLGEVSPGGTGAGLYGMLIYALLAVFIAGLMVGRTPEYLGKKIQATEMKLVTLYILIVPTLILVFSGISVVLDRATSSILNPGAHGLSEIVYAFTSTANNNGSAFGGLTGNTDWFNTTLGLSVLAGRFLPIVLVLALAGSLARKQPVPPSAGHVPDRHAAVRDAARRHRPDRRRAHVLPGALARADPGAAGAVSLRNAPRSLLDREILLRAARDSVLKLDPRRMAGNPVMFVVELGSVLVTVLAIKDPSALRLARRDLALVHGAVRDLRRGGRRGPRQGAGRRAAQDAGGDDRAPAAERLARGRPELGASPRRRGRRLGRRGDPRGRDRDRGHRERRRVRDHRRVGSGDPRVGRRPLRRHRRHARPLRPDRRQGHGAAGRELPRPDDRARRGRRAAEDAERDRAQHPARRADDRLPARGRHAAAVRDLLRRGAGRDRPRRAARLPDPDDDRRPALRDRHRGHGPPRAPQRARAQRARGRGGRRLLDAPPRQDRDDHARQPPGVRVPAAPRGRRARARGRGAALEPRRRDARGPLDRRAREGALRHPRARGRRRARSSRSPPRRG